jgi:hypothetical protein
MEFNKNNDNNNGGDEPEQPQRSAQKRKLNELANDDQPADEDKPAREDQNCSSKKNREEGNDLLDLEVCRYFELETKIIYSAQKRL